MGLPGGSFQSFQRGSGGGDPRRRVERHPSTEVSSDLGEVLDLSESGARIACKGKPPFQVGYGSTIQIRTADGAVTLPVRVVWIRRKGLRTHHVGVQFSELSSALQALLRTLAQFGFMGVHGTSIAAARAKRKAI